MPTKIDTKLRNAVQKVISKLGKPLVFEIPAAGQYDPHEGDVIRGASESFTARSIPPYKAKDMFDLSDALKRSERVTGVAAQGLEFTPAENVKVTIDGEKFIIDIVEPIYSGEQVALYLLGLKRGGRRAR